MQDHDQRFKTLIREFFGDFLRLFFADWAARLDTEHVEWLDKEMLPDPPDGPRTVLDLVARLATREPVPGQRPGEPEQLLALVHIEIESPDKATTLRWRMAHAYLDLRRRHQLPVLPIVLFLKVGLEGIGIDHYREEFWDLETIRFQYLYVGLPALDAIEYMQGDNWLGVALSALMKITPEQTAWLGMEALRRLVDAPLGEQQRFLLSECVQAYLPLDEEQQAEFERIASGTPSEGLKPMNTTWFEKGVIKGVIEERKRFLLKQLAIRFGPLTVAVTDRLNELNPEDLDKLGELILEAKSLGDLGLEDEPAE